MKLIVVSPPDDFENEHELVQQMFEEGLRYYHVRKPDWNQEQTKKYLDQFDDKYYDRLALHKYQSLAAEYGIGGVHISRLWSKGPKKVKKKVEKYREQQPNVRVTNSWHTLSTVYKQDRLIDCDYIFLSPIFDSISKEGYRAAFEKNELEMALANCPYNVIALGGIAPGKLDEARQLGFDGVAVLGHIWHSDDPVERFKQLQNEAEKVKVA